ncbi:hypothetical protein EG329_007634 [Mollisiaceae sp. DMI_Dod_QoI]|nr:hypothetical protein EG329_007634 [Helotiales sp. DMI_Dod_QoI]
MYLPRSEDLHQLAARYYYNNCYYNNNGSLRYCRSSWYRWGRWVLAGVLLAIGLILVLLFLCLARRRRRRSARFQTTQTPMTAPPGGYYNNNQQYNAPAGPPPPTYGAGVANNGYYGQQTGVAQPQGAYVK